MIEDYFSIQIFFIILRETLETAIIISVLLSFINQRSQTKSYDLQNLENSELSIKNDSLQYKLKLQVWVGAILGLVICFVIGLVFIGVFYIIGKDYWSYTERLWEGVFSLLSSIIITVMGVGLLRINKVMKVKWWIKLGDAYNETEEGIKLSDDPMAAVDEPRESVDSTRPLTGEASRTKTKFTAKYFLAILPLITTLREGLEAVVFVGGIGMSSPPTSIPLSIICGVTFGSIIGYLLYQGGNKLSLQYFLIFLTCFLYMVSAGLMSRGVWFLELEKYVRACGGLDVGETGSGPGSYDIAKSVWHVNCCNGLKDGWWMVFNAIFGWTNSATYGSVVSYVGYWLLVISWLEIRLYEEREGVLPLVPVKWQLKRIAKKVKLFETRHKQQLQASREANSPEENRAFEQNERDAESQVLLSS